MLLTVGASFAADYGRAIALLFDGLGDFELSSAVVFRDSTFTSFEQQPPDSY
jgi:hypothetical protein